MKKKLLLISYSLFFISCFSFSQTIYPTHWFTGFKNQDLQLIVHQKDVGKNFDDYNLSARNNRLADGVLLKSITRTDNPNYVFLNLEITADAKPGILHFDFSKGKSKLQFDYELKARSNQNGVSRVQGVTAKDFIYLMMPDRFSNGDPSNDVIATYREQANDRTNKFRRHGGDFQGIINHLDYLQELGVTTLWLTPVIENNTNLMHEWGNDIAGYHGYWFTDHYQIDKRFGGNEGYKNFCNTLHQNGMKVIQDAVYNHISKEHWSYIDPPAKDWINTWETFTSPHHREEVFFDPYASEYDRKKMLDGWFTDHLPDLNQRNPLVATFLIQHAIWTTEEYGIDGWRVDTYKYCDEQFMNDINTALETEFPRLTIFGESWVNSTVANAYFTQNNLNTPFKHNAEGMLDFQVAFGIMAGLNEEFGWLNGVNKLYIALTNDVLYKNPLNNCIFLDNHDMDRIFSVLGEDKNKMKTALTWLLTLRGIPQLYYGTEVLMKNLKGSTDAHVREDFPGGWEGDKESRFTKEGRSAEQNELFDFVSKLAQYRKKSSALTVGKTVQFIPDNGVYTYFRYTDEQTVMVIANTGNKPVKPVWSQFAEKTKGFAKAKDIISGKTISFDELEVAPKQSFVLELVR